MFKPIFHVIWGVSAGITLLRSGILAAVPRDSINNWQWKSVQILRKFEKPHGNAALAFASLGPSFIKFGQFLASRADIVGVSLANDLAKLQDEMPSFSMEQARKIIEIETLKPLESSFSEFSDPIAAASVAQVHKAVLKINGKTVAVKLLRPDIRKRFKSDIERMKFGAKLAEFFSPEARRLRVCKIVDSFESWARTEMDLRLEAAAISEMQQQTKTETNFRVPQLEWDYSSREMLTLEWIDGISLKNIDLIQAANINCEILAKNLLQSFLTHALNHGFFHADMHAGNLFVVGNAANSTIVAIDFGIMGRLGDKERRFFAEILWGFIRRDYDKIAQVHFDAGYVPKTQDKAAFAQALRAVGEPIHTRPANEISMARVITLLFEITSIYGMETRLELLLLQKSMVMVEGLARNLDPNINIWHTSEPIVKRWIEAELGPKAQVKHLGNAAVALSRHLPHLDIILENLVNPTVPAAPAKPSILPLIYAVGFGFIAALVILSILD